MPKLMLDIAGRRYEIGCRDGEETHFLSLARTVDERIAEAAQALGGLTEIRGLLFAALLLADDLRAKAEEPPPAPAPQVDEATINALDGLAGRLEALAATLER